MPLSPGGPRESACAGWHTWGLPEAADWYEYPLQVLGTPRRAYTLLGTEDRVALDALEGEHVSRGVEAWPWLDRWLRA